MPFDIKAAIHKPWVKYGLITVAFVGVFYILYARESGGSSSSTTSATGESDADYAADAQLQAQQMQASAAASSQDSSQSFQLAQQSEADKTNLDALGQNIAGQLSLASGTNATNIALGNIQLQGLQAQLNEASHVSDNQTVVNINTTNQAASTVKNSSNNQVKSGIITGVIGAVAAFF